MWDLVSISIITTLLSVISILLLFALLINRSVLTKGLTFLTSHRGVVFLLLLIFLVPFPFLLSSKQIINTILIYVREITISVCILLLIVMVWQVFGTIIIFPRFLSLYLQTYHTLTIWEYQIALSKWDKEQIPKYQVEELEQILSLYKWIIYQDSTGLSRLNEDAYYGDGLYPKTINTLKQELNRSQSSKPRNRDYETKLKKLITKPH